MSFQVTRMPLRFEALRRRALTYCLGAAFILLGCGAYYASEWTTYSEFSRDIDPACMTLHCDFTLFYYKQARVIRQEAKPVRKYFYSPTFALFIEPIGKLSRDEAQSAWTWVQACSLGLLIVSNVLLLRGFSPWLHALSMLLALTSYPILHNWKWGQANTTFMALIALALVLVERGLPRAGAIPLAMVVASRYYPVVYAVCFLARGRRRALIALCVASALLLVAWPVVAMGADHAYQFYAQSRDAIERATNGWISKSAASEYLPTAMARLAFGERSDWIKGALALAACNGALACLAQWRRARYHALWAFTFIALSTPLLMPTSWMHYFVYLPLVQSFLLGQIIALRERSLTLRLALSLVWLSSAAVASVFFYLQVGSADEYARLGYLLFSNLALLALAYTLFPMHLKARAYHCATSS